MISGAMGIFGAIVAPFDQPYLIFAGLGIWCFAFPISTILISIFFRKARTGIKFNVSIVGGSGAFAPAIASLEENRTH